MRRRLCAKLNAIIILFAACSATFFPVASSSATPLAPDGVWWSGLSSQDRLVAAEAAISAYGTGYGAGLSAVFREAPRSTTIQGYTAVASKITAKNAGRLQYSHTYAFYAGAISDFYAIHDDRLDITIGVLIECLADEPFASCNTMAKTLPVTTPQP